MIRHPAFFVLIFAGFSATACGGGSNTKPLDQALGFDESTFNFSAAGHLGGADVSIGEARELVAEREYQAPPIAGMEGSEDPDVDLTRARLTSIEISGEITLDGELWTFELDLESDELATFGIGKLEPSETLTIEFQLEQSERNVELQGDAVSGTFEVQKYVDEGGHPDGDAVRMGGAIGGVFSLQLGDGGGEHIEGSFHAPFEDPEIEAE